MIPSASERSSPLNHVPTVFTAAGRLIASNAPSAKRVEKNPATVVTSTWVIWARLHPPTPMAYPARTPTRSTNQPTASIEAIVAIWNPELMWA